MSSKNNKGMKIIITILLLGIIFFSIGTYSVIGSFDKKKECLFTDNNKLCELKLTMPENRELNNYNLKLSFSKQASNQIVNEQIINPFANGGDYYEEHNDAREAIGRSKEHNWIYLYRIPSNINLNDYDVIILNNTIKTTLKIRNDHANAFVKLNNGYLKYPYTNNNIIVCTEEHSRNCGDIKNRLVRWYESDGDKQTSMYNLISAKIINKYFSKATNDEGVNKAITENNYLTTKININDLKNIDYEKTALFSTIKIYEDGYDYVDYKIEEPLKTTIGFTKSYYPKNVKYYVNNKEIGVLEGEQKNNVTTKDLSDSINNNCDGTRCDVNITFESETPGIMYINGENSELKVIKSVSDKKEEPKDYVKLGSALLSTLLIFFVWKK